MLVSRRGAVRAAAGLAGIALPVWARAATTRADSAPAPANAATLDGLVFRARIVRDDADGQPPLIDRLVFANGSFSSEICTQYGFAPSPYWLRLFDGEIHFLTEMTSPTAGTMVWEGRVRSGELDGTMQWKKHRWYWTIDVTHHIQGELVVAAGPSG